MGAWDSSSNTDVSHMNSGDFCNSEKSITINQNKTVKIVFTNNNGNKTILKEDISLLDGEIIDASLMSKSALISFINSQITRALKEDVLFSLHMKATMMKVSDPIIFGHAVKCFFEPVFEKHQELFKHLDVDVNNGFGDLLNKLTKLDDSKRSEVEADIQSCYLERPGIAMVDSDKGITNLHVPSDVIIDASMPAMIRTSGRMWDHEGKTKDTLAVIPDSSYAPLYKATIDFCKKNGAFDPTTMGTVSNVGLMAQKAEEYGSHDKTFEIKENGRVEIVDSTSNNVLISHNVEKGDIWRMCQVKDEPIKDWVKLAVNRARATGWPAIFWLSEDRAHDKELINKVNTYLKEHDTNGLDIQILSLVDATNFSEKIKKWKKHYFCYWKCFKRLLNRLISYSRAWYFSKNAFDRTFNEWWWSF